MLILVHTAKSLVTVHICCFWSTLCDDGGDDFDEREPFDDLLEEVNGLANYSNEYEIDGGPGSFSEYVIYFAKSEDLVSAAQQRFIANT
jgi:hypothetical protein